MIRVLIVEDERGTAAAHVAYVQRCEGFEVTAVAHTAAAGLLAMRTAAQAGVPMQLVLLDMQLPDGHGLDVCRRMRAEGHLVDVIAVTAERGLETVRDAIAVGVVQYLIKPFAFAALADRLQRYRDYREQLDGAGKLTQQEVDRAIAALRTTNAPGLAKGLSAETLDAVAQLLADGEPRSAAEVAAALDLSRVTARRYLEHLAAAGDAERSPRHGARGRPEIEYSRTS